MEVLDYINKMINKKSAKDWACIDYAILAYLPYINYCNILNKIDSKKKERADGSFEQIESEQKIGDRVRKIERDTRITLKKAERIREKNLGEPEFLGAFDVSRMRKYTKSITTGCFKDCVITNIEVKYDKTIPLQFSAITLEISKQCAYVIFCGTDQSVAGWEEDFMMLYQRPVMAQQLAVDYLNKISSRYKKIIVGGHSKGGNLAVYASVMANEEVQNRIKAVYSFDGQGFLPDFLQLSEYKGVKDRIFHILPNESIVGRLFWMEAKEIIVKSNYSGFIQHDLLAWQVDKEDFIIVGQNQVGESIDFGKCVNGIIEKLTKEERVRFVKCIFNVLYKCGNTLKELNENKAKMIQEYMKIKPADRLLMLRVLVKLGKCLQVSKFSLGTILKYKEYKQSAIYNEKNK